VSPWNSSPEADHYVEAPIRQLALSVISSAGFGVDPSSDDPHFAPGVVPPGYTRPFSEALSFFLSNTVKIVATHYVVPQFLCSFGIFRTLDLAKQDVGKYLRQLLKKELALSANSADDRSNLISLLAAQKGDLMDDEIVGNIFIFSVAGHDTTASTLHFTFALMALHPEVQSWFQQELDEVLEDFPEDPVCWSYPELFPKLVAPMCVMFEVLRLWSVVGLLPKWTADSEQVVCGFRLPARTPIFLNIPALHYSKKVWGADADEFRPQRWHPKNTESILEEPGSGSSGLRRPVKGAWLPFSDGSRACLGKKFAQVEYCAVAAAVFSKWEVRPTGEEGKRKIEQCMSDSGTYSTLRISGDWKVKMVKRRKKQMNLAPES
jgi:cytochrome P450